MATDSAQARSFDFANPKNNVYRYDAEKLHIRDRILISEGGNPQIFAAFSRRLALESETKGGIESALKKAPTLMNRSARAWETETKIKWPKAEIANVRDSRSTYSIIVGWSERREKILAGTVADDPSLNSLAPENGFLVQCVNEDTRKAIEEMLKAKFYPKLRPADPPAPEAVIEECRTCIKKASELEEARLGFKRMGGPIRITLLDKGNQPKSFLKEDITC